MNQTPLEAFASVGQRPLVGSILVKLYFSLRLTFYFSKLLCRVCFAINVTCHKKVIGITFLFLFDIRDI